MEEYSLLYRPHPMIISMKLEARIQLKFKELDLPDEGLPGKQLLERYIGQLSNEKTQEAMREIKIILDSEYKFDLVRSNSQFQKDSQKSAQEFVAAIKENLPPHSFLSEKVSFSLISSFKICVDQLFCLPDILHCGQTSPASGAFHGKHSNLRAQFSPIQVR